MRPIHLALLAAALIGGIALYVLVVRDSGAAPVADRGPKSTASGGSEAETRTGTRTETRTTPNSADDPDRDLSKDSDGADDGDEGDGDEVREVTEVIGATGNRVRDYRGTGAPMRDPDAPLTRPFKAKRIDSGVVTSMAKELRKVARACRDSHPSDIGEGASVQTRATFAIHQERLTVTEVELSLESIPENGSFHSCIESAVLGVTVEAPGHREVDKDMMSVPIRL